MNNELLRSIDDFVDMIYTPDQSNLNGLFINVIDQLSFYVEELQKRNIMLDINRDLMDMQKAFMDKDYTLLSDILLYKISTTINEHEISN